ncbi:hypothetical protein KK062_05305 [Fulvivirgaceae bacterium PWU5]|uniref:Uncharacterized protein n=1 Tax=Dawidia cretensis TaxID=2782350 RepID=A0AAP2DX36_9BACT|nr:hypothetical protein [Dawidia cretensis]MBT1707627.1 hypothetical protein [Dawidia cretensis]
MKLIKYCKTEHNLLKTCTTLRLGTLTDFRENYTGEDDFINDAMEGRGSTVDKSGNIYINGFIVPNCYIFCVSTKTVDVSVEKDFDPNYNDYYVIDNIRHFGNAIAFLLYHQLLPTDLEETEVTKKFTAADFQQLSIKEFASQITYSESKPTSDNAIASAIFYKPEKYKVQYEYRYAFIVEHAAHGYIPVKKPGKIIETSLVKNLITGNIDTSLKWVIKNNLVVNPR